MPTDNDTDASTAKYQLSGQVKTGWRDSPQAVLEKYNEMVAEHNLRCKRESSHYVYLDGLCARGTYWETLADGTVRLQWRNSKRNAGMIYLEVRDQDEEVG